MKAEVLQYFKKVSSFAILFAMLFFIFSLQTSFAQTPPKSTTVLHLTNPLEKVIGTNPGGQQGAEGLSILIGRALQAVLGLIGVAGLVVLITGGVILLTSGGADDRIKKGKGIITGAFIGLLVIFSGYFIIELVIKALGNK